MTTTSLYMVDLKVEIAFNAGWSTPAASRVWTDVSDYVEFQERIEIKHGRQDRVGTCDPSTLALTLSNKDGRFTAGRAASPYYPNVKVGRPIRVKSTPPGGAESVRFVGFIDSWPLDWDGSDQMAYARIKASSRTAWLGRSKKFDSLGELVMRTKSPSALWPLTESEGATVGLDALGGEPFSLFRGTFGNSATLLPAMGGGEVPPDGLPTVKLPTPPNTAGAGLLRSYGGGCTSAFQDWSSILLFSGPVTATGVLFAHLMRNPANSEYFLIGLYDTGEIQIWKRVGGSTSVEATIAIDAPLDGEFHVLGLSVNANAGTSDAVVSVYLDGVLISTPTVGYSADVLSDFQVGQYDDGTLSDNFASVGRVGLWRGTLLTAGDHAEIADALLDGFLDELPGDRIERYAGYAGIATTEVAADDGITPMDAINVVGLNALELMRLVESTEGGVLFDAKDGTLTFHARSRRYSASSSFTLAIASQQVEADYAPRLDLTGVQNDVTAALASGTAAARAVDQASVDDYGAGGAPLTLHTTDENEPHAAAWWAVNTYAEPLPRVPTLSVDFLALTTGLQASVYAAAVGTRFAVTGHPTQAANSSADYFIEGWSESYGKVDARMTFNVSDATAHVSTFVLQDPVRGQLDSTYRLAY